MSERIFNTPFQSPSSEGVRIAKWLWSRRIGNYPNLVNARDGQLLFASFADFYAEELRPTKSGDEIRKDLKKIAELSNSLSRLLANTQHVENQDLQPLNEVVIKNIIGEEPALTATGAISKLKAEFLLSDFVDDIRDAASESLAYYESQKISHRPGKQLIEKLCYLAFQMIWSLNLMVGASVADARPSRQNQSFGHVATILELLASKRAPWTSPFERRPWSTTRVYEAMRAVEIVWTQQLAKVTFLEPEERWKDLGWDSFVGLFLICDCAKAFLPSDLNVHASSAEGFFAAWNAD